MCRQLPHDDEIIVSSFEVELPKLVDLNLDRNPCMKIVEEDEKNGEAPNDDALVGNKMRFLIQKVHLYNIVRLFFLILA